MAKIRDYAEIEENVGNILSGHGQSCFHSDFADTRVHQCFSLLLTASSPQERLNRTVSLQPTQAVCKEHDGSAVFSKVPRDLGVQVAFCRRSIFFLHDALYVVVGKQENSKPELCRNAP